jgi:penicillin amidase
MPLRHLLFAGLLLQTLFLSAQQIQVQGLQAPVEIIVDQWGVPHIYAQNEADLFFAQGYNAARDRLFQLEIWRRQANGTVAEILGSRELKRDIGTRLFQFRGDIQQEMQHYHPRGAKIITAFVAGVNAYIQQTEKQPDLLPIEFELLGIKPQPWTPEIVISRHQGLLGNIGTELETARQVAQLGEEKVKEINWFHPNDPDLSIDPKIDPNLFQDDLLEFYEAFRKPVKFRPEDLISEVQTPNIDYFNEIAAHEEAAFEQWQKDELNNIGSNNWAVSGDHTESGYPMLANDPHRTQSAPSLRYIAHLVAPGWNVIGGGEPEIPGISIGHNEHGAWGLTVFRTDAEDLYIYETNPDNPNQYWYKGAWEDMRIIKESIPVKGQKAVEVELKYTRHGPVSHEDQKNNKAYAIRCGWLEIGGSPYLASLRMNQASTFEAFQDACTYSHIPGENMVWADRAGNIGWQAVGIAPIRRNWSGLIPVPGDGSYEWDGYLPIQAKPNLYNPKNGLIYTANANVTPLDYAFPEALGYSWSAPYREDRIAELLSNGRKHALIDMAQYQTDYLSIPARQLVPLLLMADTDDERLAPYFSQLKGWDCRLEPKSIAAGIYNAWEQQLRADIEQLMVGAYSKLDVSIQINKVVEWLMLPDGKFGENTIAGRDQFLVGAFEKAIDKLRKKLGPDINKWQYGQAAYKHITLKHPMSDAVKTDIQQKLDVGPIARGGNSFTLNNTSSNDNQRSGASFRFIVDTGDWDACLAMNTPGQSGDPDHPHYRNLFELWAKDGFFPLFYSRKKVESVKSYEIKLAPE